VERGVNHPASIHGTPSFVCAPCLTRLSARQNVGGRAHPGSAVGCPAAVLSARDAHYARWLNRSRNPR